jgi:glucan phosphoethanolaminetransferase (alkaline phosphatase superfamily)
MLFCALMGSTTMGSRMLFCALMAGSTTMDRSMLFYASVGSTTMGSRIIFCASMASTTMDRHNGTMSVPPWVHCHCFVLPAWVLCVILCIKGIHTPQVL